MLKKINLLCLLLCLSLLVLGSCKSSPSGASATDARAAANSALGRLDEQVGGRPADVPSAPVPQQQQKEQNVSSTKQQPAINHSKSKPAWVDNVDSIYDSSQYVAAVGNASNRDMAEKNALANLAAIFGQSIKADQTITNTYQEAVKNGVTSSWTDNTAMQNTINITASMDTLIGAEVKEVWFDSRSTHYAVAVMEKARTAQIYSDLIKANQNMIANLVNMKDTEKYSLEGFSRYQFAATVADINVAYGNVLQVIGAPVPAGVVKGDNYRLEAQNITKTIPVGIIVKNDKAGRIQGAFAKALSDIGFRSGGNNSRYVLNVDITVSPVDLPNNNNKFARIELGANLTDTSVKSVLLPYNFNSREGHITASEAENRAYMAAERKINEEYKDLLSDYLNQLLPKK
ncbi:LPP20 family lipoprotein [Treponema sp. R6D11]